MRRGIERRALVGLGFGALRPALAAAADVVAGVHEDPVEPAREGRVALEAAEAPIQLEEGLLHGVLGVRRVSQQVPGDALHPTSVGPIQLLEGRGLPLAAGLHQGPLGRRPGAGLAQAGSPGRIFMKESDCWGQAVLGLRVPRLRRTRTWDR